jgi:hypothetical protein
MVGVAVASASVATFNRMIAAAPISTAKLSPLAVAIAPRTRASAPIDTQKIEGGEYTAAVTLGSRRVEHLQTADKRLGLLPQRPSPADRSPDHGNFAGVAFGRRPWQFG